MKNIFAILLALVLLSPLIVGAHMGETESLELADYSPAEMMEYIENRALGAELHEEMETLMEQMMDGSLSEAGTERMVELMQKNPGPHAMMMNRIDMIDEFDNGGMRSGNYGHMFGITGNIMGWFLWLIMIVWLVVGILIIKQSLEKSKKS
jgi:hypothetical protein